MIQIWFVVIALLIVATYTDCKKGTIPVTVFIITPIITTVWCEFKYNQYDYLSSILGLVVLGLLYFIATFMGGGGGDVVMMASLGWMLGIRTSLYIALFASIFYLLSILYLRIVKKRKEKSLTLPYAPFVALASSIMFFANMCFILV